MSQVTEIFNTSHKHSAVLKITNKEYLLKEIMFFKTSVCYNMKEVYRMSDK